MPEITAMRTLHLPAAYGTCRNKASFHREIILKYIRENVLKEALNIKSYDSITVLNLTRLEHEF